MKKYTYIIVGTAAAGISAVNKLWQLDPAASLLCISHEKEKPYNKCFLADYMAGEKIEERLFTKIVHQNVDFLFETRVVAIDKEKKELVLSDNVRVQYGSLLLATGSSPALPSIPGIDVRGVFTFHSLADTHAILSYLSEYDFSHVTIIGAGLSGLEAADALRSQNREVTVVEQAAHVLPHQIDYEAAAFIQERMNAHGVSFLPRQLATKIVQERGKVIGVVLADGTQISTNAVICATGLVPNSEIARNAELRLIKNSVWVDQYQRTSDEHIYAAGDLVVVKDQATSELVRSCTWPDAMHQGLIAAHAMANKPKPYPGITTVTSSAFFGVKFAACVSPSFFHKGEGYTTISCKGHTEEYCKMFVKDGIPRGFVMIGATLPQLGILRRAVMLKQPYAPSPYRMTPSP